MSQIRHKNVVRAIQSSFALAAFIWVVKAADIQPKHARTLGTSIFQENVGIE